ncbi:MAG TPA: hypothetical protein VE870_17795 [Bacteroidales bacterium]|nr:hypothetical protein [Bacteroidales bacterium]
MNKYTLLPLVLLTGVQAPPDKQEKVMPVIIIMADQLHFDAMGEFTPNINGLKEDSLSFSRAYTACRLYVPSRGSFFTGLYPKKNGLLIKGWSPEDLHYREVRSGIPDLYVTMDGKWDSRHVGIQHFFTRGKIDKNPGLKTKWITREDYQEWMRETILNLS